MQQTQGFVYHLRKAVKIVDLLGGIDIFFPVCLMSLRGRDGDCSTVLVGFFQSES